MEHASDCISPADKDRRIEILEALIRHALDLIEGGYVDEAALELDRALDDPSMLPPYSTASNDAEISEQS